MTQMASLSPFLHPSIHPSIHSSPELLDVLFGKFVELFHSHPPLELVEQGESLLVGNGATKTRVRFGKAGNRGGEKTNICVEREFMGWTAAAYRITWGVSAARKYVNVDMTRRGNAWNAAARTCMHAQKDANTNVSACNVCRMSNKLAAFS